MKPIVAILALAVILMQPGYAQIICQSASSDADGDGWGWENDRSCKVETTVQQPATGGTNACVADMQTFNNQIRAGFSNAGAVSSFLGSVLSAIYRHGG